MEMIIKQKYYSHYQSVSTKYNMEQKEREEGLSARCYHKKLSNPWYLIESTSFHIVSALDLSKQLREPVCMVSDGLDICSRYQASRAAVV